MEEQRTQKKVLSGVLGLSREAEEKPGGVLSRGDILVGLDVTSKKRLFEQVGLLFENNHGISRSRVFDALFARERLGSTCVGGGIAIPHGRVKGLHSPIAGVVALHTPILFGACGNPVRLVVVLLAPETEAGVHFDLLAELAGMLVDQVFRDALLVCSNPDQIHEMLRGWGLLFRNRARSE